MSTPTDTRFSIIDGAQKRDPERWREFYAIYKPMLMGYFRKQGLCDGTAQDLTHDVFLKLFENIHSYDHARSRFRTWLFTQARWTLIDQARRRKTQQNALEEWVNVVLNAAKHDEERQREEFEREHHERVLRFAFEKVRAKSSEKAWLCFEMSVIRGLSGAEVGKALGIKTNTVYVTSWRVLQEVKKVCHRYDEDLKHESDDRLS